MNSSYNFSEFKKVLTNIGLVKGDCVFIHSSLKTIGKYEDSTKPDLLVMIVDAIFDLIGPKGLIAVPTFNFNFAKGDDFDVDNTPSIGMGIFSEFIRKSSDSNRTTHPMHSISILGNNSAYITNLKGNTEFSEGSTFDYLLKKNCKWICYSTMFKTETYSR